MKKFLFSNCTFVQNALFLEGILGGLPAKMNLSDGQIDYFDRMEGFIPREKSTIIDFCDCFQNKVYALDSGEGYLIIWDLKNLKCEYIYLGCCRQPWINFVAFERVESDYYIFPKYENKIMVFHTDKNELTEITGYLDPMEELQCACRVGEYIWILPKDTDCIYCYELSSNKKKSYELGRTLQDCVHAVFYHGCLYILNKYGIVYQWNIEKAKLQEITLLETVHEGEIPMGRLICAGGKLILLPAYGSDIQIMDLTTGKTETYQDYPADYDDQTEWWKYYGYCEDASYYYFAACAGNYLLRIEKQSGRLTWIKLKLDFLGGKTIDFMKRKVFHESDYYELTDLMQMKIGDMEDHAQEHVGETIYCAVKGR